MSAVVLRELVAKLGFQVDEAGFKKADDGVNRVKKDLEALDKRMRDARGRFLTGIRQMGAASQQAANDNRKRARESAAKGGAGGVEALGGQLGRFLTGAAVTAGIAHMLELASSANETNNVLQQVFGANGEAQVHAWAETTAREVGRSKYALEQSASAFGAMLVPMTGNAELAQEMSTRFAKLAVDLGSFFNASDDDALAALKSGITGEIEPLRRFGIVMTDAALAEYAHAQGIRKKTQDMTVAEKTSLRYKYILAQVTKADGDAARTADGYANMLKRIQGRIRDLTTDLGKRFLPTAEKVLKWLGTAIDEFETLTKETNLVTAAIVVLGGALALAFGAPLLSIATTIALFAALILVVEDLITWFKGGRSAFGLLLEKMLGAKEAAEVLDHARKAVDLLREAWVKLTDALANVDWAKAVDKLIYKLRTLVEIAKVAPKALLLGLAKMMPGQQQIEAEDEEETAKIEAGLYGNRPRRAARQFMSAAERDLRKAVEEAQLSAARAANLADPRTAYANPNISYAPGAVSSPFAPPPAAQGPTLNQGDTIINNYLPPNANVQDYVRAQQNADAIQRRRTKAALERTAP